MSTRMMSLAALAMPLVAGCTSGGISTVSFRQYSLQPEPVQTVSKSDIDIRVQVLRPTDVYDYPQLFSFNQDDYPAFENSVFIRQNNPADPSGRQWDYWFASPDGSEQVLILDVELRNGTDHILRMSDARVYLVADGGNPIPAMGSLEQLLSETDRFWDMYVEIARTSIAGILDVEFIPPPRFPRTVLMDGRPRPELITEVGREILPGFTFRGVLAFPVIPATYSSLTLSFFDITTQTDAAGNPVLREQFDFTLSPEDMQMWFDETSVRWREGMPPAGQ